MENFIYQNKTKIIFGKSQPDILAKEILNYGKKVLIVTGKSSSKASGLLDRSISELKKWNIEFCIFNSVSTNPRVKDADAAVAIAKQEKVDLILAIGGGSVIDTAKAISIGFFVDHSVFDFYLSKSTPTKALPVITILTLAATGSEMNPYSVLQDDELEIKKGLGHPLLFPVLSFLDPENTFSVPINYTAYGVVDIFSHALETYFGKGNSSLSDHYVASIIKVGIEQMYILQKDQKDYEARAQVMWLATNALNTYLGTGKGVGDWGSHSLEHVLSVLFDIPHGAGLSIVFPAWLKYYGLRNPAKLAFLTKEVFNVDEKNIEKSAQIFIEKLEIFFKNIDSPIRLSDVNIGKDQHTKILQCFKKNKVNGNTYPILEEEYADLISLMN